MRYRYLFSVMVTALLCFSACQNRDSVAITTNAALPTVKPVEISDKTETPGSVLPALATLDLASTIIPAATPTNDSLSVLNTKTYWIPSNLPESIKQELRFPQQMFQASDKNLADIRLIVGKDSDGKQRNCLEEYIWVYALVAPFPTVDDGVDLTELRGFWKDADLTIFGRRPLLMDEETASVLTTAWGAPNEGVIRIVSSEEMVDEAWQAKRAWGILPFEALNAHWKVLSISGMTPFDRSLDLTAYPLAVSLCWEGDTLVYQAWKNWLGKEGVVIESTNRDLNKMTILNMTGVTALVRGTAAVMEEKGILYPAQDVGEWLREADLTHLSNEVSFSEDCPPGLPLRSGMSFCSKIEYFDMLEKIGVDIIELTGNHINDWGTDAFLYTLDFYHEEGVLVFGAGKNLEAAQQPLLIEDHGNKIAFIGCNSVGPEKAIATDILPGAAPCERDWLATEIRNVIGKGYLPVVTFQHIEVCNMTAHATQFTDFTAAAKAGAVIISGSQSHCPQMFAFEGDTLIHFGLGNLFFDQTDFASRRGFIDRHVFYDGRYLGVELATTMLEEGARPRFMLIAERRQLLREIFEASGW